MKALKDVPILHATGDHSKCGAEWCHAKKAQQENKPYNKKPQFVSPQDDREIEQIRKIHESYTTDEKLRQMHHPWNTQLNESLNMRLAEYAPKHRHFSRSDTLQHRVHTVIAIHNLGYLAFYSRVFHLLDIHDCPFALEWYEKRDLRKQTQKAYDTKFETKRKRAHKADAKRKELIFEERTKTPKDGDYKVQNQDKESAQKRKKAATKGTDSKAEDQNGGGEEKPKRRRSRKPCLCGKGGPHYNKNHKKCKFNPNREETDDEVSKDKVSTSPATDSADIDKLT